MGEDEEEEGGNAEQVNPTHYSELDPKNMKVADLRRELECRQLSSKGLKSQLIARLTKAIKSEQEKEEQEAAEHVEEEEEKPEENQDKEEVDSREEEKKKKEEEERKKKEDRLYQITLQSWYIPILQLKAESSTVQSCHLVYYSIIGQRITRNTRLRFLCSRS